jgi:hypothetical protein
MGYSTNSTPTAVRRDDEKVNGRVVALHNGANTVAFFKAPT